MDVKILHIDDENDVLEKASKIITGTKIRAHRLVVQDSCGFEEGLKKLETNEYDLVVLDLCVGKATEVSDKIGMTIFDQIKLRAFIPIVFFTGLPDYVRDLESDIVRIAGKGDGYDALFYQIDRILETGFIELKADVNVVIKEGVRSFFWDFVHPNRTAIDLLKKDDISLKYLLLRRLGKTLSNELTRSVVEDPKFSKELSHPMEYYIYPPVNGEYETCDIVRHKKSGDLSVIFTPSCDLVLRSSGTRKAEKVLLVHALNFKSVAPYREYEAMKQSHAQLEKEKKAISKEDIGKLKNKRNDLVKLMGTENERYFFLPQTPFLDASLIDFQHKVTVSYHELDGNYETVASLDDPIAQAIIAKYTRYYSRIGYRDLDREYALSAIEGI